MVDQRRAGTPGAPWDYPWPLSIVDLIIAIIHHCPPRYRERPRGKDPRAEASLSTAFIKRSDSFRLYLRGTFCSDYYVLPYCPCRVNSEVLNKGFIDLFFLIAAKEVFILIYFFGKSHIQREVQ